MTAGRPLRFFPLTRVDLDATPCSDCGRLGDHAHELVLRALCHPLAGLQVAYLDGVLSLCCASCSAPVSTIQVAVHLPVVASTLRSREGRRAIITPVIETLRILEHSKDAPSLTITTKFEADFSRLGHAFGQTDASDALTEVLEALSRKNISDFVAICERWIASAPEDRHVH